MRDNSNNPRAIGARAPVGAGDIRLGRALGRSRCCLVAIMALCAATGADGSPTAFAADVKVEIRGMGGDFSGVAAAVWRDSALHPGTAAARRTAHVLRATAEASSRQAVQGKSDKVATSPSYAIDAAARGEEWRDPDYSRERGTPALEHCEIDARGVLLTCGDYDAEPHNGDLVLRDTGITAIATGAFANTTGVRWLDLSHNWISTLQDDVFTGVEGVADLMLSSNHVLSRVESRAFHGLEELVALYLDNNQISYFGYGALAPCVTLQYVHLRNNSLQSQPSGNLPRFLETLSLGHNRIEEIDLTVLGWHKLPSLGYLDVSFNALKRAVTAQDQPLAASIIDLSQNPSMTANVGDLLQMLKFSTSVDLTGTSVSGGIPAHIFSDELFSLRFLDILRTPNLSGPLPDDIGNIVSLNAMNSGLRSHRLPSYMMTSEGQVSESDGRAFCKIAVPKPEFASRNVRVDFAYDNYARCGCRAGFQQAKNASTRVDCEECPFGTWSSDNSTRCGGCGAGAFERSNLCQFCSSGQFSPPGPGTVDRCTACPSDSTRCSPGSFEVNPGFWWPGSLSLPPKTLYPCLDRASCIPPAPVRITEPSGDGTDDAALSNLTVTCREGGSGPLCAVCIAGYARTEPGICTKCLPTASSTTVAVVFFTLTFAMVAYCTVGHVPKLHRHSAAEVRSLSTAVSAAQLTGSEGASDEAEDQPGVFITLIGHVQNVTLIAAFHTKTPALLEPIYNATHFLGNNVMAIFGAPAACAMKKWTYIDTVWATALFPVVGVGLAAAYIAVQRCRSSKRRENGLSFTDDVVHAAVALGLLVWPSLIFTPLTALSVHPPIEGVTYLRRDFNVVADSPEYIVAKYLSIAMLVVYGLVLPLLTYSAVARMRMQDLHRAEAIYGMLFENYRPSLWWWKSTQLGRMGLLAAITALLPDGQTQIFMGCLVTIPGFMAHMSLRPHSTKPSLVLQGRLDIAEALSLVTLLVMLVGGVAFLGASVEDESTAAQDIVSLVLLLFNSVTLCVLLYWFFSKVPCCRRAPCYRAVGRKALAGPRRPSVMLAERLLEPDEASA